MTEQDNDNEVKVTVPKHVLEALIDGETEHIRVREDTGRPSTIPIAETDLDEVVDLLGIVRSVDDINTFDRDDGERGQVRNIRIQDATGDLRCALWGEHADVRVSVGDYIHLTGVEIQDGYQDYLEGSVGWDGQVRIIDDPSAANRHVTIEVVTE